MIANFFNKTKPVNVLNITVLLLVFYVSSVVLNNSEPMTVAFFAENAVCFLRLLIIVLIINFILKKNNLTQDNSYTSLLVVLFIGTFSETMFANYIIYSNILLLLAYRKVFSLKSGLNVESKLFDAGFWVGIAVLCYSWSILYVVLIYIGMIIHQKLTIKNLFIPAVGFVTPIIIYFTYNFYFDQMEVFYSRFNFAVNLNFTEYNTIKILLPISFLAIIMLLAVVSVTPKIVAVSNKFKLSWNALLHQLLISIIVVFLAPMKNGSELLFIIFPSAVIITNFLQKIESPKFKNLILYLFLVLSISVYFL